MPVRGLIVEEPHEAGGNATDLLGFRAVARFARLHPELLQQVVEVDSHVVDG
jgi:hypothetical protein